MNKTSQRHTAKQRAEAARIGERLRWAREAHGLSVRELAEHAGTGKAQLNHIENGVRAPSIFLAQTLIHILRISPQYLLWGSLQGVEGVISAKLAQAHPELLDSVEIRHRDSPSPGKTGKLPRSKGQSRQAA